MLVDVNGNGEVSYIDGAGVKATGWLPDVCLRWQVSPSPTAEEVRLAAADRMHRDDTHHNENNDDRHYDDGGMHGGDDGGMHGGGDDEDNDDRHYERTPPWVPEEVLQRIPPNPKYQGSTPENPLPSGRACSLPG